MTKCQKVFLSIVTCVMGASPCFAAPPTKEIKQYESAIRQAEESRVARLGQVFWDKKISPDEGSIEITKIKAIGNGNFLLAGIRHNEKNSNAHVRLVDNQAELLWERNFGTNFEFVGDVHLLPDNDLYIASISERVGSIRHRGYTKVEGRSAFRVNPQNKFMWTGWEEDYSAVAVFPQNNDEAIMGYTLGPRYRVSILKRIRQKYKYKDGVKRTDKRSKTKDIWEVDLGITEAFFSSDKSSNIYASGKSRDWVAQENEYQENIVTKKVSLLGEVIWEYAFQGSRIYESEPHPEGGVVLSVLIDKKYHIIYIDKDGKEVWRTMVDAKWITILPDSGLLVGNAETIVRLDRNGVKLWDKTYSSKYKRDDKFIVGGAAKDANTVLLTGWEDTTAFIMSVNVPEN